MSVGESGLAGCSGSWRSLIVTPVVAVTVRVGAARTPRNRGRRCPTVCPMAGPLHIRAARPDDAADLAALHVRAWRETYAEEVPEHVYARMEEDGPERWARRLEDPDASTTWVGTVRETGELGGFSRAEATGTGEVRPLLLSGLYVLARWYGQGLGQALLEHAIGDAPAYLWVAE